MKRCKKLILIILILLVILAAAMSAKTGLLSSTKEATTEVSAHEGFYYEAVFLDNDDISGLFEKMRDAAPFENVTQDFHVTIEFMPETKHPEFYGKTVNVHITAYKIGEVKDDDGKPTSNEGFKAELNTDDPELQKYLESIPKNYHITGAYQDGAKYTEYIDFSDGEPLDIHVSGIYGCGYQDGFIDLGK